MPVVFWIILMLIAAALAAMAPAWAVAILIPVATGYSLLMGRTTRRATQIRIETLAEQLEETASASSAAISKEARRAETIRAYLDSAGSPIIATDNAGRVTMMNTPARSLFSRTDHDADLTIQDLTANPDVLTLHSRAAAGEPGREKTRLSPEGLSRFYDVSASPVPGGGDESPPSRLGVVVTFRDIHALAQTLRLRTDFAANASHELRTPIATIKAAIETLRGPAADDPAMHAKLEEVIENNATRLEETVNDLLDLSRLEDSEAQPANEPIDAQALCDALRGRFDDVCARRGLTLEFQIDPALKTMTSDRKRLVLILRNLIDNATKFAFEQTTILVRGDAIGPATARFSVADNGVGIPLQHQARVFERFFQVDQSHARTGSRRGSGLGLSIVRHAVKNLDGTINIESVWQEGTTVTVILPGSVEPNPKTESV